MDPLTWGALIAAGGSIVTAIKFWMDIGSALSKAAGAEQAAAIAIGKIEILGREFADYRVTAAKEFASFKALTETEARIATSIVQSEGRIAASVDRINDSFGSMGARLDRFMEARK